MGGSNISNFSLNKMLNKRVHFLFSTLRSRTDDYKTSLIQNFKKDILPGFKNKFKPIIDKTFSAYEIIKAHERMEKNENIGKIVIKSIWS
jgi:NADPH:quinone reductase-like Zn-dependent oxidoreductase